MQDKQLHISKKMTAQGWAEMSKLLDQEMPAPVKERKRFGWWWLMLGLLIGLASGIFAVKYFMGGPVKAEPAAADQPIAVAPALGSETAGMENREDVAQADLPATTPTETVEKTGSHSPFLSKQPAPARSAPSAQPPVNAASNPTPTGGDNINKPAYFPPSSILDHEKPLATEIQKTTADQLAAVEKLTAPPTLPLSLPEKPVPLLPAEWPVAKRTAFSIYGTGMSSFVAGAGGFAAGVTASMDLKQSKFSLMGGLGYAFVQQPLSVIFTSEEQVGVSSNAAFTGYNAELGDNKLDRTESSSSNKARLLNKLQMHYLNVPLMASYQILPRLSLRGGANVGILLASSSDYTAGGILDGATNTESFKANDLNYSGDLFGARLNPFDFSAVAGADYRLNHSLSAGFGYQFGLSDVIPDNKASDHNRFFLITLRYFLPVSRH